MMMIWRMTMVHEVGAEDFLRQWNRFDDRSNDRSHPFVGRCALLIVRRLRHYVDVRWRHMRMRAPSWSSYRGGLWIYWQVRCGLIILLRLTKLIWIVWSGGEATAIVADWASSRLQYGRILQHRTLRIGFVCIGSKAMIGLDIALNFTQRFSEVGIMLPKCCSPLNRPSSWILHLCDVLRVHRVYCSPSVYLSVTLL